MRRHAVWHCRLWILTVLFSLFAPGPVFGQTTSLTLSSGTTALSGTVTLPLNLTVPSGNSNPVALQWVVSYAPGDVVSLNIAAGSVLTASAKTLSCNAISGFTTCLATGMNSNSIGDGTVAVITVTLATSTSGPSVPVSIVNTLGVLAGGTAATVSGVGGTITVQQPNPVPTISSLSPSSAAAGSAGLTLTVNGTGFVGGSVVNWSGSIGSTVFVIALATTFVSTTQLQAVVPASDISSAATVQVTVFNPSPGGGTSTASPFTINPASLMIAKTHAGNFTQGLTGATYTVTVSNQAGAGITSGVVTVTETVPSGLTLVSMVGAGWTCPGGNTCTRSDALNGGASYPQITVTVNVAATAPPLVTNQASVSGGGSPQASAGDSTVIAAVPGQVTLTSPANGATSQSRTPTLSWSASSGATAYDLYLGTSNPPGLYQQNLSGTSYGVTTALNGGTTYYWNVVAKNSAGSAPASGTWSFATAVSGR